MTITPNEVVRNEPRSGLADTLRAEFCKLRSVRSTYWTLLAALAFDLAFAALEAILLPGQLSDHDKATLDAVRVSLGGSHLSQIAFGVLGVLVITSEYTTGMIRVTLSAVPRRRLVLGAKAIVFATTGVVVGVAASFAAYFVFQALLSGNSLRSSVGDPGVVRALIGGGLYLTVLGLLGLGLGGIIRSSAGAIAALFTLLFVPQVLVELLPQSWKTTIGPYVPMQAGSQIFSQHHEAGALGPWSGFGIFSLYAVVALIAAFVLIDRRDA
jgi:ABC-type transport system involved in multi-copper enzyme maturation permease subunit